MATILGLSYKGGSFYQVTQTALGGSGTSTLYGQLDREAQSVATTVSWEHSGAMVAQLGDAIYLLVCESGTAPRIYKGYDGAILVRTDGVDPTPTLPLAGETITQGLVSGTLVEDYKANDDFFVVTGEAGGTFGAGTVTFTTGNDAVLISREDNGGQFALEFESAQTTDGISAGFSKGSGLHHGLVSGKPSLGFMFIDGSNNIWTCTRNPTSGLWSENDSGINTSVSFRGNSGSVVHRNTIYWVKDGDNSRDIMSVMTMNISTGVVTYTAATFTNNTTCVPGAPIIWNGRIFCSYNSNNTVGQLREISGGAIVTVSSLSFSVVVWVKSTPGTCFVGTDDNALYVVIVGSGGLSLVKRFYDDGTNIVLSCPAGVTNALDTEVGEVMLPAAIRTGMSTVSHGHSFLDIETTLGTKIQRFWHYNGSLVGGTEFKYTDSVALDSGIAATVSGTIGSPNDLEFQNSVAASLVVGDWVILADSNSCFRVAAVSLTDVQLENLTGATGGTAIIQPTPSAGSEIIRKVQVMGTESGSEGGLSGVALPHGTVGGGHVYTVGEVSGEFTDQTPVPNGVRLEFTIFDPFTNSLGADITARGYFLKEDGTIGQMTLSAVGQATKSGNSNTLLSSGVGQTFTWASLTDGVTDGQFTDKFLEIELT